MTMDIGHNACAGRYETEALGNYKQYSGEQPLHQG